MEPKNIKQTLKDIKGFEGLYAISKNGDVWSYRNNIFLKHNKFKNKIWYHSVHLSKDRKSVSVKVHRLVAQTYIPNPINLREVNHKNGMKEDNRVENLEWCTSSENKKHARENGLCRWVSGEQSGAAKLTWDIVNNIRKDYAVKNGLPRKCHKTSFRKLAAKYNITKSNIEAIVNGRTWKQSLARPITS